MPRQRTIIDLRAYMAVKNRERREAAKRAGICISCNDDKADPGRTKCCTCRMIEQARRKAA